MPNNIQINTRAAIELLEAEIANAVANIFRPGTDAGVRTVTLTVKIKPSDNKQTAAIQMSAQSKGRPSADYTAMTLIGQENGQVAIVEQQSQLSFDLDRVERMESEA